MGPLAVNPNEEHSVAEALVALAAQDGLGDPIDWQDVKAAVANLISDPLGPRSLRMVLERLNNQEVRRTLADWFARAAAEREEDAKGAARAGEKLLAPLQMVSLGGSVTAAVGIAGGTLGAVIAVPLLTCTLTVAGAASYGRWRLSKRQDEAEADASSIRRLGGMLDDK